MNNFRPIFPEYNVETISNIMSLRKPQKQSLKILDSILDEIPLTKTRNLVQEEMDIKSLYPLFQGYEHDFMSLTFALATGVGKTKLMGAFITYLYTNKGIKNFFIVAPNLTIYEKLKNDLGEPGIENVKYVFRGVSCFSVNKPNIWVGDDYLNKPLINTVDNDNSINIYIYNISKFDSDKRNFRDEKNEAIGKSFFSYLKELEDLVIIMDESHHYRADQSSQALNELSPILGLELTATPQTQKGNRTYLFKNVVYEYPLSKSIIDGYTRTPYALTRSDFNSSNLTDEEKDKIMIGDGIKHHENIKTELKRYYLNNKDEGVRLVKPFTLIVCKDTTHAEKVLEYIKSPSFRNGEYKNKVIMIHSNQRGQEKEENIKLLLDVEKTDNPIEIVIHVNILKEGWDVNNLYTIIPLRTATSRTLREQTIGRGLRLPYGKRTGSKWVDSVAITAHDKFREIVEEAQSTDSIFHSMGVIYMDQQRNRQTTTVRVSLFDENTIRNEIMSRAGLDHNNPEHAQMLNDVAESINNHVAEQLLHRNGNEHVDRETIRTSVQEDLANRYSANEEVDRLIQTVFKDLRNDVIEQAEQRVMFIPQIKTEQFSGEIYKISDFDLDLNEMRYVPLRDDIVIQNLINQNEQADVIRGEMINYDSIIPEQELIKGICEINEVDYEKDPQLIQKIVMQFLNNYRARFSEDEVKNIILMNRRDIINKFKAQLLQHLTIRYTGIVETISGIKTAVSDYVIDTTDGVRDFHQPPATGENIKTIAYNGAIKAVQSPFKFDSNPERMFAIAIDGATSPEVIQWLRPSPTQFNITYNGGRKYEPDFVVETEDCYYLTEVKARDKMNDPDVIAKKERAIKYCKAASEYNKAHGHKPFKYLFIPDDAINISSSFNNLKNRFIEE